MHRHFTIKLVPSAEPPATTGQVNSKPFALLLLFNSGMSNWRPAGRMRPTWIMNEARENILRSAVSTANQKSVLTICVG